MIMGDLRIGDLYKVRRNILWRSVGETKVEHGVTFYSKVATYPDGPGYIVLITIVGKIAMKYRPVPRLDHMCLLYDQAQWLVVLAEDGRLWFASERHCHWRICDRTRRLHAFCINT